MEAAISHDCAGWFFAERLPTLASLPDSHLVTEYFQVIGGAAGLIILIYADNQPTGFPGQSVEIGFVLACNWRLRVSVVTMDDMAMPVPDVRAIRITLPEQRFLVLLLKRNVRIHRRMDKYSVPIDMHQREIDNPIQMVAWDCSQIRKRWGLIIRRQRFPSPVLDPPVEFGPMLADRAHHRFVVALQIDDLEFIRAPTHETLDDLSAPRPAIDVIAQCDDRGSRTLSMPGNRINSAVQQIQPAMKVGYDVCSAQGNLRNRC
jgi:hypothetical protein